MKIKCDLLVADLQRKLVFIPPGTAFDPDSMHAQDGEGSDITIGRSTASQYRLKEYRTRLLEYRSFFLDTPGQIKDWTG